MAESDNPLPQLDLVEQRVLGALLEKQHTVPGSYPLTMNALRAACNQATSRDPVTDYDEHTLHQAVGGLRDRGLLRTVWTGAGSRTVKFHQRLAEHLALDEPAQAVLTVLLLRGAQTTGELRTRCERLHPFSDRSAVEEALHELAARPLPLVLELPLAAGQQDHRWVHLLAPVPGPDPSAESADLDAVLSGGAEQRDLRVAAGYDAAAQGYTRELAEELDGKPFDRWLLTRVAGEAAGPVLDVGCGPGQVTAFLADAGADASGLDLSPGMIEIAAGRRPDLTFAVGDLTRVLRPPAASGWAAITAWYALVHLAGSELAATLEALTRVLVPGGILALALHVGSEVRHVDEFFGAAVDLDFVLHDADQIKAAASAAGLVDIEWYLRSPLPGTGESTERLYLLGRAPG